MFKISDYSNYIENEDEGDNSTGVMKQNNTLSFNSTPNSTSARNDYLSSSLKASSQIYEADTYPSTPMFIQKQHDTATTSIQPLAKGNTPTTTDEWSNDFYSHQGLHWIMNSIPQELSPCSTTYLDSFVYVIKQYDSGDSLADFGKMLSSVQMFNPNDDCHDSSSLDGDLSSNFAMTQHNDSMLPSTTPRTINNRDNKTKQLSFMTPSVRTRGYNDRHNHHNNYNNLKESKSVNYSFYRKTDTTATDLFTNTGNTTTLYQLSKNLTKTTTLTDFIFDQKDNFSSNSTSALSIIHYTPPCQCLFAQNNNQNKTNTQHNNTHSPNSSFASDSDIPKSSIKHKSGEYCKDDLTSVDTPKSNNVSNSPTTASSSSVNKSNTSKFKEGHPHSCKPCAFFWNKGCNNGDDCIFCHSWHVPRRKKPMREQRNLMIIAKDEGKITFLRCSSRNPNT